MPPHSHSGVSTFPPAQHRLVRHRGVLLLVDVWFDVMTASPRDRPTSIITGVCGNIPLALILMGIGIQIGRRIYQLAEKATDDIEHDLWASWAELAAGQP